VCQKALTSPNTRFFHNCRKKPILVLTVIQWCINIKKASMPRKTITRKNREARERIMKMQTLLADILHEHQHDIPENVYDKLLDVYIA